MCELFERVGVESRLDCGALGVTSSFAEPATLYPSRVDRLISLLGRTRLTPSFQDQVPLPPDDVPPPCVPTGSGCADPPPPWHKIVNGGYDCSLFGSCDPKYLIIETQLDVATVYGTQGWSFDPCGEDAEDGWCATEGFYDAGGGVHQVASLSRGLTKCSAVDSRTCMDGIISGYSDGNASVCKKCGFLNDPEFCGPGGCTSAQSDPDVGSFLVLPEPSSTLLLASGVAMLLALDRRRRRRG